MSGSRSDGGSAVPGEEATAGMPRWVKRLLIVVAIVVALLVITQLVGGGHGPGRHRALPAPELVS